MTIKLNDKPREVAEGATVGSLMQELGVDGRGTAVALNGHFVPKPTWADTALTEGADLVIIKAAYGG